MAVHNFRDGALTIKDNAGTPHTLAVTLMDGNFAWSEKRDIKIIRARGLLDHLRLGDEQVMPVSFKFKYTELLGASVTPYEILKGVGGAAAYTYTAKTGAGYDLTDACDVKVVQLFFVVTLVGGGTESMEFPNFAYETVDFSEGEEANEIGVVGICPQQAPIIT